MPFFASQSHFPVFFSVRIIINNLPSMTYNRPPFILLPKKEQRSAHNLFRPKIFFEILTQLMALCADVESKDRVGKIIIILILLEISSLEAP